MLEFILVIVVIYVLFKVIYTTKKNQVKSDEPIKEVDNSNNLYEKDFFSKSYKKDISNKDFLTKTYAYNSSNESQLNIRTKSQRFKIAIPKDYRIYFHIMEVAGTYFYKSNIAKAFSHNNISITLEADPTNEFDKNALKIIATANNKKFHIGHIPKDIAKIIKDREILDYLLPRLKYINFINDDNILIEFDILGLKSEYYKIS